MRVVSSNWVVGLGRLALSMASCVLAFTTAEAEIRTITATGEYRMGDNDTRIDAKRLALLDAKRLALEQAGTYIESITQIKNFDLTKDEIRAYTAGIVELIEHRTRTILEGETTVIHVEVTAKIDTDDVARQIDTLRKNGIAKTELLKAKDEAAQLHQELEAKSHELAALRAKNDVEVVARQRRQVIAQSDVNELIRQAIALWTLYHAKDSRWDESARNGLKRAQELTEQAVGLQPSNTEAHLLLGFILLDISRSQEAQREFRFVLRQDPASAYAHLGLAHAFKVQNDLSGAIAEYRTVLSLASNEGIKAEGYFGIGEVLASQRDSDGAILAYRNGLALAPDHAKAHAGLAFTLVGKDQLDSAINEMQTVIRLDPMSPYGYLLLGKLLELKGDLKSAIAAVRKGIALAPEIPSAHIQLGALLHDTGDERGAIDEYRLALALDKNNPKARLGLGEALEAKGDREDAIDEYKQVLKHTPNDARAHLKLGQAFEAKGEREGAIVEYREAVRLNPDSAFAHQRLAYYLERAGDLSGAVAELRELLRLEPSDSVARHLADLTLEVSSNVLAPDATASTPGHPRLDREVTLFFEQALWRAEDFKNQERRSYYFALIAGTQAAAGDKHGAFQTMSRIQHKRFRARAVQDIAIEQARSGDAQSARQTIALIHGDAVWALMCRAQALAAIAAALAKKGDHAEADRLLQDALKGARSLRLDGSPIERAETLIAVASGYAESGNADASAKIFREVYETITLAQSLNDFAKHRLLDKLWEAGVNAGDVDGARKTVESFGSDSMKEMAYNKIAGAQAAAGNVLDAQKMLKELPANSRYESTLVAVSKAQAKKGDTSHAAQTLREAMERVHNSDGALVTWLQFAPLADIVEAVVSIWNDKRAIEMLARIRESLKSHKMDEFEKALIWPRLAKAHAKIRGQARNFQGISARSRSCNQDQRPPSTSRGISRDRDCTG